MGRGEEQPSTATDVSACTRPYYHYVRHLDLLAAGRFAAVSTPYVDWQIYLAVGTTGVRIEYRDAQYALATEEQNGEVKLVVDKTGTPFLLPDTKLSAAGGQPEPKGAVKRRDIWTLTFGIGTRLTYFPIDPVGVFADVVLLYSYWQAFSPNEGPLNLHIAFGLEAHF